QRLVANSSVIFSLWIARMCRFEHQLKNLVLCIHSVSNELPSSEFQKGPKLEQLTMTPKLGNRPYSRARPRFIGLLPKNVKIATFAICSAPVRCYECSSVL